METHTIRRVDIAVYSPDRKLQLVVEIKNKLGASAEWVTRMRHNSLTQVCTKRLHTVLLRLKIQYDCIMIVTA